MLEILLDATVRAGTPILFATLGAIINERAGIINLGIEGLMLIGALAGFAGTYTSGSLFVGVVTAFVMAFLAGAIHAFITVQLRGNQIVSGLALTMFGIGMKERDAAEVTVAHTDLASFTALVDYLLSDKFDLGEEEGRAQRALDLRELAQMYQVPRLELLCAQALQESVAPATAVPLLEAAHTRGRPRRRGAGERRRGAAARLWRGQGAARRRARPGGGAQGRDARAPRRGELRNRIDQGMTQVSTYIRHMQLAGSQGPGILYPARRTEPCGVRNSTDNTHVC